MKRSKGSKDAAKSYCDDDGYSDGCSATAEQGSMFSLSDLVFAISSAATMLPTEDSFSSSSEDEIDRSDEVTGQMKLNILLCL